MIGLLLEVCAGNLFLVLGKIQEVGHDSPEAVHGLWCMLPALNPLLDSWRMIRLLLVVAFARCFPATPCAPLSVCSFGHTRTENALRRGLPDKE